jgi:hypothetical protein
MVIQMDLYLVTTIALGALLIGMLLGVWCGVVVGRSLSSHRSGPRY